MVLEEYENLIATPLFSNLSEKEYNEVINCFAPSEHLYKKGESITIDLFSSSVGIVLSGWLSIYRHDFAGNRMLLLEIMPGELLGLPSYFSDDNNLNITIYANRDTRVAFIQPLFF